MIVAALMLTCPGNASNLEKTIINTKGLNRSTPDSIVIQSRDVSCRGTDPILTVSGQNITWYADAGKSIRLAQGNTYHSAPLDATTTFYVTQNRNGIESAVQSIIIEIVDPFLLEAKITPASCGKKDGTITVVGKGGTKRYPLNFQINDAPLQTSPFFSNLSGGSYKLRIWAAGCFGTSNVTVGQEPTPLIAAIDSIAPNWG